MPQAATGRHRGRRFRRQIALIGAAVLVATASGGAVALWAGDSGSGTSAIITAAPPAPPLPTPRVVPLPASAPAPTGAGISRDIAGPLADPALGTFSGQITDAATGASLWSAAAEIPAVPASALKLLTATAALLELGPDHQVSTSVSATATPGRLVLTAGGDVTLSNRPLGEPSYYINAPRLVDLATAITAAGAPVTSLVVDASAYAGSTWASGWFDEDITGGYISPIEPVMIDAARLDDSNGDSPRSRTPALDVGITLAARLGLGPDAVSVSLAPVAVAGAPIAVATSAPLDDRLGQMVAESDNVLAEAIGREIAVAHGSPPTVDGAATAVREILAAAGIDLAGAAIADGSGLSVDNRVPPRLLDALLSAAAGAGDPRLRPLLDVVPIAGATGTLAARFRQAAAAGAGWVRAKTGTLTGTSTLAGFVTTVDGRVLTFALMSSGTAPDEARPALDAIAAGLRGCGCR